MYTTHTCEWRLNCHFVIINAIVYAIAAEFMHYQQQASTKVSKQRVLCYRWNDICWCLQHYDILSFICCMCGLIHNSTMLKARYAWEKWKLYLHMYHYTSKANSKLVRCNELWFIDITRWPVLFLMCTAQI